MSKPYRIRHGTLEEWCGNLGYLPRAVLSRNAWQRIAPALEAEIVRQRKAAGLRRGSWAGTIELSRTEGKEALLLFWGAERATDETLLVVIANWRGLAPEERWWLVTQADATRGSASYHPERGWRAAIVHILTENGV